MAEKLRKGLLITFEGAEGSGKSTQSGFLYRDLLSCGYEIVYTREPGGTDLGRAIRALLLNNKSVSLSNKAELFLFEADRAQHVEEVILPALEAKKIIICDRFNTATLAYQGYGLGMDMNFIKTVDNAARSGVSPHLTIFLDIDARLGLSRAAHTRMFDRMEEREIKFHEKVCNAYRILQKEMPRKIKKIKVEENKTKEEVYKAVRKEAYDFIARYKRPG